MKNLLEDIIRPAEHVPTYEPKDFKVENDVRWCSGCGSYAILSQVQKILPELGVPKEKIVFVSGIGCSGRFSYYVDTYGFHAIHGRAIAIATGLKIARPDLSVWVATGDGDCMSIGGNHMIHAARRNVDINVLMFNNEVYSLTKGQYSPTSRQGQVTKSSPMGVLEEPFNPAQLALGSSATFVGRGFDRDAKQLKDLLQAAQQHKGFSFVEVFTNCVIFNDGAFDFFSNRKERKENTVNLVPGEPLIFGENEDKAILLDGFKPKVVSLSDAHYNPNELLRHDPADQTLAWLLAQMSYNDADLPRAFGVLRQVEKPSIDEMSTLQIEMASKGVDPDDLDGLLRGKDFWQVGVEG